MFIQLGDCSLDGAYVSCVRFRFASRCSLAIFISICICVYCSLFEFVCLFDYALLSSLIKTNKRVYIYPLISMVQNSVSGLPYHNQLFSVLIDGKKISTFKMKLNSWNSMQSIPPIIIEITWLNLLLLLCKLISFKHLKSNTNKKIPRAKEEWRKKKNSRKRAKANTFSQIKRKTPNLQGTFLRYTLAFGKRDKNWKKIKTIFLNNFRGL